MNRKDSDPLLDLIGTFNRHGVDTEKVWQTRVSGSLRGQAVSYIAKGLLIQNKLAVGRPQDVSDVQKLETQKKFKDKNKDGGRERGS